MSFYGPWCNVVGHSVVEEWMKNKYFKNELAEMKKMRKDPLLLIMIALILISLMLFIVYPLVKVCIVSFTYQGHFSFKNFFDAMTYSKGYYAKAL